MTLREIDDYIQSLCVPDDPFAQAVREADAAGLPPIHVSPNEGKLLYLLVKLAGARRVLELGLLAGYSTLWLASALPDDGHLTTLEIDPEHAAVARKNLARAGLSGKVDIRLGPASASLATLVAARPAAFDLVFIDADKEGYPGYLDFALQLTQPGSLILADNVIRDGRVANLSPADAGARAIGAFNRKLAAHPSLETIIIPVMRGTVDGLAIARVR